MNALHYIGFDVHKKTISFCVKTAAGEIVEEGVVAAQRAGLRQWASTQPDGGEGLAKRKGEITLAARRGLKEAWSKGASR